MDCPASADGNDCATDSVEDIDGARYLSDDVLGHELGNERFKGGVFDYETQSERRMFLA